MDNIFESELTEKIIKESYQSQVVEYTDKDCEVIPELYY